MSQFPNNQRIDTKTQTVFETPLQQGVYQETMPYLSTPSFTIDKGVNYGAIVDTALETSAQMYSGYLKYQANKTQVALESIADESNNNLQNLYDAGATEERVEQEKADMKLKVGTLLGYDPTEDDQDEPPQGSIPQRQWLTARKMVSGVDASNAKYIRNERADDMITRANEAAMQVQEAYLDNPNIGPEELDKGIASTENILRGAMGLKPGDSLTYKSISTIENPRDKDTAMKIYGVILGLKKERSEYEGNVKKGKANQLKDMAAEATDTFKGFKIKSDALNERNKQLSAISEEDRTDAQTIELVQTRFEHQQLDKKIQEFSIWLQKPEEIGSRIQQQSPFDYLDRSTPESRSTPVYSDPVRWDSDDFSEASLHDMAVEHPELRTAYAGVRSSMSEGITIEAKRHIEYNKAQLTASIKQAKNKQDMSDVSLTMAIAVSRNNGTFEADKEGFSKESARFASEVVVDIMRNLPPAHLARLSQKHVNAAKTTKSNEARMLEEDKNNGYPSVQRLLSFDVSPDQYENIVNALEGNDTAVEVWIAGYKAYHKQQTEIFGTSDGDGVSRKRRESQRSALEQLVAQRTPDAKTPPRDYTEAADGVIQNTNKKADGSEYNLSNIKDVRELSAAMAADPNSFKITQGFIDVSSMYATMVEGSNTPQELLALIKPFLFKDENGVVIPTKPTNVSGVTTASQFPAPPLISNILNNSNAESPRYQMAVTAFAILPPEWRSQVLSGVGDGLKKVSLSRLDATLREYPQANLQELLSRSTHGGHSNQNIQASEEYSKGILGFFETAVYRRGDDVRATRFVSLMDAVTAKLKDTGSQANSGLKSRESSLDWQSAPPGDKAAYKEILGRAAFLYSLNATTLTDETDLDKAMSSAVDQASIEFDSTRIIDSKGLRDSTQQAEDRVQVLNDSTTAKHVFDMITNPAFRFQGDTHSASVLHKDLSAQHRNGDPASKSSVQKEAGPSPEFPDMVAKIAGDAQVFTKTTTNFLESSFNMSPQEAVGNILWAIKPTGKQEFSRGEVIINAAVLKEISNRHRETPFNSKEEVLAFAVKTAADIRGSLRNNSEQNKESPYTWSYSTKGIVGGIPYYSIDIMKKVGNTHRRLAGSVSDLLSVKDTTFQTRGDATDEQGIRKIESRELLKLPDQTLKSRVEKLVADGFITDSVRITLTDEERRSIDNDNPYWDRRGVGQKILDNSSMSKAFIDIAVSPDGTVDVHRWLGVKNPQGLSSSGKFDSEWEAQKEEAARRTPMANDWVGEEQPMDPNYVSPVPTDYRPDVRAPASEEEDPNNQAYWVGPEQPMDPNYVDLTPFWSNQKARNSYAPGDLGEGDPYSEIDPMSPEYWLGQEQSMTTDSMKPNDWVGQEQSIAGSFVYGSVDRPGDAPDELLSESTMSAVPRGYTIKYIRELNRLKAGDYTNVKPAVMPQPQSYQAEKIIEGKSQLLQQLSKPYSINTSKKKMTTFGGMLFEKVTDESLYQSLTNIYGEEITNRLIREAKERQAKPFNTAGNTDLPEYKDTELYNPLEIYSYKPKFPGMDLDTEAFTGREKTTDKVRIFLADKMRWDEKATKAILVHEGVHGMQMNQNSKNRAFSSVIYGNLPEYEAYVLNTRELPAWLAGMKAQYFQETKKPLFANDSEEAYQEFYNWLKTVPDNKFGGAAKILHGVLDGRSEKKNRFTREMLRRIAFVPMTNTGTQTFNT